MADEIKYNNIPNPTFPLGKDGSNNWYPFRVSTIGGVYAGSFSGYYDVYRSVSIVNSGSGGTTYVFTGFVPAGYLYVVQRLTGYHDDPTARLCVLGLESSGVEYILAIKNTLGQYDGLVCESEIVLKEGERLKFSAYSLGANKNARVQAVGYKVKL